LQEHASRIVDACGRLPARAAWYNNWHLNFWSPFQAAITSARWQVRNQPFLGSPDEAVVIVVHSSMPVKQPHPGHAQQVQV
jgi:hypothetical protein